MSTKTVYILPQVTVAEPCKVHLQVPEKNVKINMYLSNVCHSVIYICTYAVLTRRVVKMVGILAINFFAFYALRRNRDKIMTTHLTLYRSEGKIDSWSINI